MSRSNSTVNLSVGWCRYFRADSSEDQALTSFQNVMKGNTPASLSDIHHYRSWMHKNAPITEVEQRFLDDPDDLLTVCAHRPCPTCGRHATPANDPTKGITLVFITVMPLFTLSLVLVSPQMGVLFIVFMGFTIFSNRYNCPQVLVEMKDIVVSLFNYVYARR
jgi:hypothetical protein